jgi:hypothetical protein
MAPTKDTREPEAAKSSGKGAAFALLGIGIIIVVGGGIGLEIALSHQRGPDAARAANEAAMARSRTDASAPPAPSHESHAPMP